MLASSSASIFPQAQLTGLRPMLTQVIDYLGRNCSWRKVLRRSALVSLLLGTQFSQLTSAQALPGKSAGTASAQEITRLESGSTVERELTAGSSHSYQVMLAKGQYARVVVEQHRADVIIRVTTPDGEMIGEIDAELGDQGRETVEVVAESEGPYLIKVDG